MKVIPLLMMIPPVVFMPALFVFSTYLPLFLLKFQAEELVGCGILIPYLMSTHIAYFWGTPLPQKQEIPKKT